MIICGLVALNKQQINWEEIKESIGMLEIHNSSERVSSKIYYKCRFLVPEA